MCIMYGNMKNTHVMYICMSYEEKGFNNGSMLSQDYTEIQALHVHLLE